jgi:hypothetical protein
MNKKRRARNGKEAMDRRNADISLTYILQAT